ncbi:hypothetical protein, conserved [Angomonas deanei]|uniref:Flagellar attachment zone protein 1 conserved domain-containing protein n=1 Tax=Angomonas deanei TaxID=59799 RepID=A0A7G2C1N4_9TRYP|nr:hypothetical protein, conserved [Angomonas deanei]
MSQFEEDAEMKISGEMWMCADSEKPTKVGAGRGTKNFITIEKDRFYVYSSRSSQSKQIKEIAFRSMKRIAWFVHKPGATTATSTGGAARRPRGSTTQPGVYYYLILEFVRDNAKVGTVSIGKRERIVLCTDDSQDFDIWKQFVEMYESPLIHEYIEGRDRKKSGGRGPTQGGGAADHDDTTSDEDEALSPAESIALWRNRALRLINDIACITNPTLQIQADRAAAVDWDKQSEELVHCVEQNAGTVQRAGSPPNVASTSDSDDHLKAELNSLRKELETFRTAAFDTITFLDGEQPPTDPKETHATTLTSSLSHYRSGSNNTNKMLCEWNNMYSKYLGDGQTYSDTNTSGFHLDDQLARCRKVSESLELLEQSKDLIQKGGNSELLSTCQRIIETFIQEESKGRLTINSEAASAVKKAKTVDSQVELLYKSVMEELEASRAQLEAAQQRVSDSESSVSELKRKISQSASETQELEQQNLDICRRLKQLERLQSTVIQLYSDSVTDVLRSSYREYASLRNLFLSIIRGDGDDSFDDSRDIPGKGSEKLVVSAAHLEAVQALENERQATREKQEELERVMLELDNLRIERDKEIGELQSNLNAAKEIWKRDVDVLESQLKNKTLLSDAPSNAFVLPTLDDTPVVNLSDDVYNSHKTRKVPTESSKDSPDNLLRCSSYLVAHKGEEGIDAAEAAKRLEHFYLWSLETLVPIHSSHAESSVLEMAIYTFRHYTELLTTINDVTDALCSADTTGQLDSLAKLQHIKQKHADVKSVLLKRLGDDWENPDDVHEIDTKLNQLQSAVASGTETQRLLTAAEAQVAALSEELEQKTSTATEKEQQMTAEKESVDAENAQLKGLVDTLQLSLEKERQESSEKETGLLESLAAEQTKFQEYETIQASVLAESREEIDKLRAETDELMNALEETRAQNHEVESTVRQELNSALNDRTQKEEECEQLRSLVATLQQHDERWLTATDRGEAVTTAHTKVFEGDEWDIVLDGKTEALRTAFSYDAASACHVLPTAIDNITFALGSLHVNFTVEHSDSVTKEELDDRISSYPFRCVDDLYRNRHAPKSGADALKETLAATEAQVAALNEELEQKTSTATEKEQQMTAEKESVDAENAQLKETLAATEAQVAALSEELEQKTSTATEKEQQLTAEKESVDAENAQLKESLVDNLQLSLEK